MIGMKICNKCGTEFNDINLICPVCNESPVINDGYKCFSLDSVKSGNGFDESLFSKLSVIEERNFWFKTRNKLIIWSLKNFFPEAKSFLEIGCGTGFVLSGIEKAYPQLNLFGSELFCEGLKYASKRVKNCELFQMDARNIPFKNEFDIIGAFDVLEHLKEDEEVLAQLYKAVTNQGGIILTVPQHEFLWSQEDDAACHVRRYNVKDLIKKVEQSGFQVKFVTSFVSLVFPFMLISRFSKKINKKNSDSMSEFRIPRFINNILEEILLFEQKLINRGIRFPFGGSLLLIACKR